MLTSLGEEWVGRTSWHTHKDLFTPLAQYHEHTQSLIAAGSQ